MAENNMGWRRDRDRAYRDDDRDWNRRTEDYRREGSGWGRDQDYGRESNKRDWSGRDWSQRGRERGFGGAEPSRRDWTRGWTQDRDRERDEWSGRYGREDWGRGYRRLPGYGGAPGGWGFSEEYGRDPNWDYGTYYGRYTRYDDRPEYSERDRQRGWWDRASDEVASWFGDEGAERRRREDERHDIYRGRGPRGYIRSDDRIREDVSDRLTDNPILDASDVEVSVSSGEVTLSGHVDSRYSKRLAEDIAEDVSGVRHVQNNLRVRENRESISGTWSGISEGGTTSDLGRTSTSGTTGSTGIGNTAGSMTGKETSKTR
jgi:osmotically-inducible protein OsmY